MKKQIICTVSMFDLHQRVKLINEDGQEKDIAITTLGDLAETITDCAMKYATPNIHLFGYDSYLSNVVKNIKKYALARYSQESIHVEVN